MSCLMISPPFLNEAKKRKRPLSFGRRTSTEVIPMNHQLTGFYLLNFIYLIFRKIFHLLIEVEQLNSARERFAIDQIAGSDVKLHHLDPFSSLLPQAENNDVANPCLFKNERQVKFLFCVY